MRRRIRQLESLVGFLGESAAYWAEQYQAIAEFAAPPSTAEPSSQAESAEQPGTPAEDTDAARFDGQRKARWSE